jgi:hypothetical protein
MFNTFFKPILLKTLKLTVNISVQVQTEKSNLPTSIVSDFSSMFQFLYEQNSSSIFYRLLVQLQFHKIVDAFIIH